MREAWDTIVLDEAQAIKNPDSQIARAAFSLRGALRLTLTGTPVENRLDEPWSQLHFANPGLLGPLRDFRERYARPIASGEPGAAAHLRARIAPFVLRRMKSVVAAELPPRTRLDRVTPAARPKSDACSSPTPRQVHRVRSVFTLIVLLGLLILAAGTGFWAWREIGSVEIGMHGWIALGLGAGLTFLVGAGLMALMFFSSRSGHDEAADPFRRKPEPPAE